MRMSRPSLSIHSPLQWVRLTVLTGLVAAGLATGLAVETSAPANAASKVHSCGLVSAGGQKYAVSATAVSCSSAKKWVAKLAGKHVTSSFSALSHGPSGYTCHGGAAPKGSPVNGVPMNVQTNGSCHKGLIATGSSPNFSWQNQKVQ
jgi:hypothetical protein